MAVNHQERAELVKAMETICRSINNEDIFYGWLMCGVADGDINRKTTLDEIIEMGYTEDGSFIDLMDCFLRKMRSAYEDGGLYCAGATSTEGNKEV